MEWKYVAIFVRHCIVGIGDIKKYGHREKWKKAKQINLGAIVATFYLIHCTKLGVILIMGYWENVFEV